MAAEAIPNLECKLGLGIASLALLARNDGTLLDRPPAHLYNLPSPHEWAFAEVAQLVEHATENRGVAGSIPALGTYVAAGASTIGEATRLRRVTLLQTLT